MKNIINNEVIPLYSESGKVDCYLRPDKHREQDRKDRDAFNLQRARGIIPADQTVAETGVRLQSAVVRS